MTRISGTPQPKQPTSNAGAWLGGQYTTMRLVGDVEAVRVQAVVGVSAAGRDSPVGAASLGSMGRWFAVGDVILARSASPSSRVAPRGFSRVDWCRLKAGSIINVGRCSPQFGHVGGGEQVEFVSGPQPEQVVAADS